MNFFEKFKGFDDGIVHEFALSLVPHTRTHATVTIRGLSIEVNPEFIIRVTTLPLGPPWSKNEKKIGQVAKRNFFQANETPMKTKMEFRGLVYHIPGMRLATKRSNTFLVRGGTTVFMDIISGSSKN